eukprot:10957162-Lingulodinium_polyedra.AAC.1
MFRRAGVAFRAAFEGAPPSLMTRLSAASTPNGQSCALIRGMLDRRKMSWLSAPSLRARFCRWGHGWGDARADSGRWSNVV